MDRHSDDGNANFPLIARIKEIEIIMTVGTMTTTGRCPCPVRVICPGCRGELDLAGQTIRCTRCGNLFQRVGGFPDLIVGGRFEDATTEVKMLYEENSNTYTTRNYWIPLFRRLWGNQTRTPRLLSVGCGIGIDVDLLAEKGFECIGIDCGNRTAFWRRREHPERLLLANGMNMPFDDASFDGVFCGCVFPHVGVVGDTYQVTPQYREDRLRLAREMTRVLRPGGKVVVSSPNRHFPFDLFHDRAEGSYRPRLNSPTSPFLLSHADYRRLFQAAGCTATSLLSVHQYWGFIRSEHSLRGRMAGALPKFVFWLVSQPGARWLLSSPLNPWLVVLAQKPVAS